MPVYLDHAATSWPKAPGVDQAVLKSLGIAGAPGRGSHTGAIAGSQLIAQARHAVARWFGAESDRHVVFTSGGTESLNLAIHSLLRPAAHVVTTAAEHNSVLRPLEHRRVQGQGDYSVVAVDRTGRWSVESVLAAIRPETRACLVTHVSNVTGAIGPVEELAERCTELGVAVIVDAAQSAGLLRIKAARSAVALWAASGHKGLLGPLGTGVLIVNPAFAESLQPWKCGGTGLQSELLSMPDSLPEKLEAGNPALPAIAGLGASVHWLLEHALEHLELERQNTAALWTGLEKLPGVRRVGPLRLEEHVGPTSIVVEGWDVHDLANVLDASYDVRARAGRHCAALIHRDIETEASGGTLRITPGYSTTESDIEKVLAALEEILGG